MLYEVITDIADKYGFITALDGEPIGHISWDPRNLPEYVAIGHNCIATKYKGNGYGKRQLQEAIDRIRQYDGIKKIIVGTNSNLIAPHNYESVGFKLCQTRKNESDTDFVITSYSIHYTKLYELGFSGNEAASIGIIGGADGPTAIFVTTKLAPHLLGPIAVAAYSYMAVITSYSIHYTKLYDHHK